MILFLDFDGVLHPECEDKPVSEDMEFSHLPRFEAIMREFPLVEMVISSMWRYVVCLDDLKARFSEDIQPRIIGTTPLYECAEGNGLPARREAEILEWLVRHDRSRDDWLALDDLDREFLDHADRLVACISHRGFDADAAEALRARLAERFDEGVRT